MSTSSKLQPVKKRIASVIFVLLLGSYVDATDQLDQALEQASAFQRSEINLIEARLELENWKHYQIEDLHTQGFATWLELRRHQFEVEKIDAKLEAALRFQNLLSDVVSKKRCSTANQRLVFRERQSIPIKVYQPDSIRLIGWIEGHSTTGPEVPEIDESAIKVAREKLKRAQHRFDVSIHSNSTAAKWREKATLELALAKRELEHVQATDTRPSPLGGMAEPTDFNGEVENVVSPADSEALQLATIRVKQAQAGASSHITIAELMLAREQRRADAVRRLHWQGYASEKELGLVNERVSRIKSQLDGLVDHRKTHKGSPATSAHSNRSATGDDQFSVDAWPEVAFGDKEFAMHLIELRRAIFLEFVDSETDRLKGMFLQQVLDRLNAAATPSSPDHPTGFVLNVGQQNEIESYRMDIEHARASSAAAAERQQILILEENRFIQQVIAQNNAAQHQLERVNTTALDSFGLLSRIQPTAIIASNIDLRARTRFSYLESGYLEGATNLALEKNRRRLDLSPYSTKSLELFNSKPPRQPEVWVGGTDRSRSPQREWRVEGTGTSFFHDRLRQNSYQTLRMSGPPYYDAWPQKVYYGQYGYRAISGTDAYPNHILRADWKSNLTPGQVPWYAPGSAANIRANQLFYRRNP